MAAEELQPSFCVKFYSSYGAYHSNAVNKAIHIVCVPLIIWSFMCFMEFTPAKEFHTFGYAFDANFGHIVWVLHLLLGFYCDFFAGASLSLLYFGLLASAKHLFLSIEHPMLMYAAIAGQVIGWGAQFVGHGVFEKRKPALFDNLLQVHAAPFFVVLEVLFLCGYNKELYQSCQKEITFLNANKGSKHN